MKIEIITIFSYKLFPQAIWRTREKLCIVINYNEDLFKKRLKFSTEQHKMKMCKIMDGRGKSEEENKSLHLGQL